MTVGFEPADYGELGFSKLLQDFVNPEKRDFFKTFYTSGFPVESGDFVRHAEKRPSGLNRSDAADLLMAFNSGFNPPQKVIDNILALKKTNVWTATAGQQPGLFGGPVFCLLKALTVIATAKHLSETTGMKVVPVFWIADEDHDYDEIRSASFPGSASQNDAPQTLSLKPQSGAEFATGDINLNDEISEALNRVLLLAGKGNGTAAGLSELLESWKSGLPWIQAFGRMMMNVFGEYGLVLAGSHHPEIKKAAAPLWDKVLRNPDEIKSLLEIQSSRFEEHYPKQVEVGGSQLFWHHRKMGRVKLEWKKEQWTFPGDPSLSLTDGEAADFVEENDFYERLSPNVFLRPVLQEYLLPNLAYFGGAAEIAYHGQMKPLFEYFDLKMPLILPRLSATFCEPQIAGVMEHFSFTFRDYKQPEAVLQRRWAESSEGYELNKLFTQWQEDLKGLTDLHRKSLDGLGETLQTSVNSTTVRMQNELKKLKTRAVREVRRKEDVQINRLSRIHHALFPDGVLQERKLAWVWLSAKYGPVLVRDVLAQLEKKPLDYLRSHQIIYL